MAQGGLWKIIPLLFITVSVISALAIDNKSGLEQSVLQLETTVHLILQLLQKEQSFGTEGSVIPDQKVRQSITEFASQTETQIEKRISEKIEKQLNNFLNRLNRLEKRLDETDEDLDKDVAPLNPSACARIESGIANTSVYFDTKQEERLMNWEIQTSDLETIRNLLNDWRRGFSSCRFPLDRMYGEKPTEISVLHLAATVDDVKVARILIRRGAEVDVKTVLQTVHRDYKISPIHLATMFNATKVVKLLLENKADINNNDGPTPLHFVSDVIIANLLIDNGANVSADSNVTSLPLHEAAKRKNSVPILKLLLEKGAVVNAKDDEGYTALHDASIKGINENVEFLIQNGADVNVGTNDGTTPLHLAASEWYGLSTMKLLLDKGADINAKDAEGRTPLYLCYDKPSYKNAKFLIENGADMNVKGPKGFSLIHAAVQQYAAGEVLELLLGKGFDINVKDDDGRTPLQFCLEYHRPEYAKFLIDKGADIHARTKSGETPLHLAAKMTRESVPVMKMLLEKGADVDAKDSLNRTPLYSSYLGWSWPESGEFLAENGADVNVKFNTTTALHHAVCLRTPHFASLLLERNARIDEQDGEGRTALHRAIKCGGLEAIKLLLNKGADISLKDKDGVSPLSLGLSPLKELSANTSKKINDFFKSYQ